MQFSRVAKRTSGKWQKFSHGLLCLLIKGKTMGRDVPLHCCTVACFCTLHLKGDLILIFTVNLISKETSTEGISTEHLKNLNPARQLRSCLISSHGDRAGLSELQFAVCKCQNKSLQETIPHHGHSQRYLRRQEPSSWLYSLKLP